MKCDRFFDRCRANKGERRNAITIKASMNEERSDGILIATLHYFKEVYGIIDVNANANYSARPTNYIALDMVRIPARLALM